MVNCQLQPELNYSPRKTCMSSFERLSRSLHGIICQKAVILLVDDAIWACHVLPSFPDEQTAFVSTTQFLSFIAGTSPQHLDEISDGILHVLRQVILCLFELAIRQLEERAETALPSSYDLDELSGHVLFSLVKAGVKAQWVCVVTFRPLCVARWLNNVDRIDEVDAAAGVLVPRCQVFLPAELGRARIEDVPQTRRKCQADYDVRAEGVVPEAMR